MKRIVTIQDISCIGKCSLTVALPLISCFGVETAIIPTAVLSTHTAFNEFTFHDLTDDIEPIMANWKKQNFHFDGIYTGYLGSIRQIELMKKFFDTFAEENTLKIVDPCMADFGSLYKGFDKEFAFEMASLCSKADIILPNLTEASFLLGRDCLDSNYSEDDIKEMMVALSKLGAKKVILKGISFNKQKSSFKGIDGKIGICYYNQERDKYSWYFHKKIEQNFHGTGDVFASVFTGAMIENFSIESSYTLAADFVLKTIEYTIKDKNHNFYGVNFESAIPFLVKEIEKRKHLN